SHRDLREWVPLGAAVGAMVCAIFAILTYQAQATQDKIDKAVAPIGVRLDAFEKHTATKFEALDHRVTEMEKRIDVRFTEMEKRVDTRFTETDKRMTAQFDAVHKALERLNQKLDRR